jgi:hypothetical protein
MMRTTGLTILTLLVAVLAASKARAEDDPKTCAAIPEDDRRLECYDLIFRKSEVEIPTTSQWDVQEEVSKVDDTSNVYVFVDSSNTFQMTYGKPMSRLSPLPATAQLAA